MSEKTARPTPISSGTAQSLPRHLRSPGEDGYRTPTIEDFNHSHDALQKNLPSTLHDVSPSGVSGRDMASSVEARDMLPSVEARDMLPDDDLRFFSENKLKAGRTDDFWAEKLNWRQRIKHFTWAYFTLTMATGGLANVLYTVPLRFHGLTAIGDIFFLVNIIFFIVNCALSGIRFYYYPYMFKASFCHPTESLFIPSVIVSFGTILINISQYGLEHTGLWLNDVVEVLFWLYCGLAFSFSFGIYLTLWSTQYFSISQMTPIWIFPAYPLLVIGPHAGVLTTHLTSHRAFLIVIGGFTLQGIGFMVSMMVYSAYIYRLMTQKLPKESLRPGMFVSVGPSGFTVAGLINMAHSASKIFPDDFMDNGQLTATIFKVGCNWAALWLWGLAVYFFFISAFAHYSTLSGSRMTFAMTWYSFVFPNTALVTATFAVGKAFRCHAINVVGCVMTCVLILAYFAVFAMMIRAVVVHDILWPQQGEDKNEGGFRVETFRPEGQESPGGLGKSGATSRFRAFSRGRRSAEETAAGNGDAAIEKSYTSGRDANVGLGVA